jgi:HD-like signal output (HDOD) protein
MRALQLAKVRTQRTQDAANTTETAPRRKRIGELLVAEDYVKPEHVKEALEHQQREGGKIVEILIKLGYLEAQAFARFISNQRGIPSIELQHYKVPQELCKLIPREYAVKHEVFPIDKLAKLLTVGMAFPLDSDTIEELERMTGLRVKALLISRTDLDRAIDQYYGKKDAKKDDGITEDEIVSTVKLRHIAQMVRELDQLPTLPQTVQRVQEATKDPESSLRDVAEIIAHDPPVAAKLLRLANSAAYGFTNKIDSVERATTLLGLKETYMVVLSSAVLDLMEKSKHFDIERFWNHSMLCAITARGVAEFKGEKRRGGYFTAGLLHDIGRFALSEVAQKLYATIDPSLVGCALVEEEQNVLGIAHPEAGFLLAQHWGFPPEICEPIRFHHAPELAKDAQETVHLIAISAAIAEAHTGEELDAEKFNARCGEQLMAWNFSASEAYRIYQDALRISRETQA